jgi:uncharacterized protein (DUF1499 family)
VAAGGFVIGPVVAYLGITPPMVGFVLFGLGGLLGLVGFVIAVIAALRGGASAAARGLITGGLVTGAFLVIALPGRGFPRINDITTDTVNPPQFVKAGALDGNEGRDLRYPGASFAEQQRAGYPTLAPLKVPLPPDEVFKRVESTARQMPSWEITRVDAGARALEGVATSGLFRFKDDLVVEVRAENGASVVQMRSKSRDGRGDIGANAARIEAFLAKLK